MSSNKIFILLLAASCLTTFLATTAFLKSITSKQQSIANQISPAPIFKQNLLTNNQALFSYIKAYGIKQTMTKLQSESSQTNLSCHQAAHRTGRLAYQLFGEKSFSMCTPECQSGCYHGASEAYFEKNGTANLSEKLNEICGTQLNQFMQYQCIHGLGHGLMSWSSYDLPDALHYCDYVKHPEGCYTGVFMENIVGGLSADHKTQYLNNDPHYPCTIVSEKYKGQCYFYQTTRMLQLFGHDFSKVALSCSKAPNKYQDLCFESMGRDVGGAVYDNPTEAIKKCQFAPFGNFRQDCIEGAVQNGFWDPSGQDTALQFCKLLTEKDEKSVCYQTIFYRAPFVLTNRGELQTFCKKVESSYQSKCFSSS